MKEETIKVIMLQPGKLAKAVFLYHVILIALLCVDLC